MVRGADPTPLRRGRPVNGPVAESREWALRKNGGTHAYRNNG
jgi:hypothetical protein